MFACLLLNCFSILYMHVQWWKQTLNIQKRGHLVRAKQTKKSIGASKLKKKGGGGVNVAKHPYHQLIGMFGNIEKQYYNNKQYMHICIYHLAVKNYPYYALFISFHFAFVLFHFVSYHFILLHFTIEYKSIMKSHWTSMRK